MDHKEKQIILSIIISILVFACYSLYVYHKYMAGNMEIINDFKFWGKSFLIFIPVAILAQIIIYIVFAIINKMVTNEDIPTLSDERDKLIDLKAIRISHWMFTLGLLLAMGSQAMGMKPYVMFVVLIFSGFVSSILAEIAKLYFYRKGF